MAMFWPFYDPYAVLLLPALLLAIWAQHQVSSAYARWSQVAARSGWSGADLARALLRRYGLDHVAVQPVAGHLTDHYDPRVRVVRLSHDVYHGRSLAALGIAAHEVGHAIQHATGYAPLHVRNAIIPVTQFGSQLAFPLFFLGFFVRWDPLMEAGILLFLTVVLFQVITLPVEFNASARALALLAEGGYLAPDEIGPTRSVLNAAALTYVAALVMAVAQLVRLLLYWQHARERD